MVIFRKGKLPTLLPINKEVEFRKKSTTYWVCSHKCSSEYCNRISFIWDLGFWPLRHTVRFYNLKWLQWFKMTSFLKVKKGNSATQSPFSTCKHSVIFQLHDTALPCAQFYLITCNHDNQLYLIISLITTAPHGGEITLVFVHICGFDETTWSLPCVVLKINPTYNTVIYTSWISLLSEPQGYFYISHFGINK